MVFGACKKKEAPAVVEEAPASEAKETDTTATMAEEPTLQHVGKDAKPGSAKATFHPSKAATQAGFSEKGHFVVQVSIFKSKKKAAALVEKLAQAGFPAYVAEVENPIPEMAGTWHRVRVGNFMRVSDAKAFGENTLSGMGYQFWVDNKKNDAVAGNGSYTAPAPEPSYQRSSVPAAVPSEPAAPSEPATPPTETWGAPEPEKTPEPVAPSSSTIPKTTPSPSGTPATKSPNDTGKVNLDEW